MARIRTIKPEFWTDEKLVELDYVDRLLFIGLFNFVDDQGFIDYRPKRIKMQVFPGDDVDVVAGLARLRDASLVTPYEADTGVVIHVNNWTKHQRVSNPARERYSLSDLHECDPFGKPSRALTRPLDSYPAEGKGKEVEGKGRDLSSPAVADQRPDVEALCNRLAARVEENGSKKPTITKEWRDAARLMIDKDGRTYDQILYLIDWAQSDAFWRSNILSMQKLRKQFDQLRLKATAPQRKNTDINWDAANQRAAARDGVS